MFPYLAVFALFALIAIVERPEPQESRRRSLSFLFAGILLTLFIGTRYDVGGDWPTYQHAFWAAQFQSLGDTLSMRDPAYELLNWLGQAAGFGIWAVNLVCAAIFSWGLLRLARTQPRPWMVLLLAVPYMITVVSMGYTRQAAAMGIIMASFASIVQGGGVARSILYTLAATLFHRTALVMLPFTAIASGKRQLWSLALVIPAFYGLYTTFIASEMGSLVHGYIEEKYSSGGAGVRVALLVIPASLFLIAGKRLGFEGNERRLWLYLSIAAFACLVMLFLLPSSTVVDRLALYVLPLQIVVLARVPGTVVGAGIGKTLLLIYAAAVLLVWLTLGSFSSAWLPYRSFLFGASIGSGGV